MGEEEHDLFGDMEAEKKETDEEPTEDIFGNVLPQGETGGENTPPAPEEPKAPVRKNPKISGSVEMAEGKFIAKCHIRHNKIDYDKGAIIKKLTKSEAKILLDDGDIERVSQ